jgi:tetrapyrrole methylase family protein / MazG family protein
VITVVGLGPGDLERVAAATLTRLSDPANRVIVRTLRHPAAATLAQRRPVETCDDLYEEAARFDDLYAAVAERLLEAGHHGDVIYAVPGSPLVGEFAVTTLRTLATERGIGLEVLPAESFIDAALAAVGYDPLDRGLILLNGQNLPDPLVLDHPTIIGHLPDRVLMGDVISRLNRVLPEDTGATVLVDLGTAAARVIATTVAAIDPVYAGLRTSVFIDPPPSGLVGAVTVMRRLRRECPWDLRQTHRSLLTHLLEESSEFVDAVAALPVEAPGGEPDWVAYSAVEEELGDLLLQVLFHTVMAEEAGAFTIDDVAEGLRRKLVRRHPHVFGEVEASTPGEVLRNWEAIKSDEQAAGRSSPPRPPSRSLMDGLPASMGGLTRAAKLQKRAASVGFDWEGPAGVVPKLAEELGELAEVIDQPERAEREIGDLLFTLINLTRHLGLDSEVALRGAVARFEARFRRMEELEENLPGRSLAQLDELWERAKAEEALREG